MWLHTTNLLDDLKLRGMISQTTNDAEISRRLERKSIIYLGIDPTAKSLHVGHLLPLMVLLQLFLRGHEVIPLIGGATGLVGDPSGKTEERSPLGKEKAVDNVESLTRAVDGFFASASEYGSKRLHSSQYDPPNSTPKVANNVEWLGSLGLLEFLTKAGRHARIPTMISRDSVKIRISSPQGLSFTEFTYQLLQAYDFYHLYNTRGCTLQLGGSDQWGNILAGVDLIDRTRTKEQPIAHGLTTPLLTTVSGAKFGKSEGNAVWLNKGLTSVLDFYQFFVRTADADVGKYLYMFTLLPTHDIADILKKHEAAPEKRFVQRRLADEVVELIHGREAVNRARIATQALFETSLANLSARDIVTALEGDPRLVRCTREETIAQPIWKLAGKYKLSSSNSEARRLATSKGLYLNNVAVDVQKTLQETDLIDDGVAVLRAGKDNHLVVALHQN
ncbi:uncharacterized protein FOMMEDRAFT_146925 [Fomitiporia mediterranea MF3/22]|uniref:uncharacterized protein n=1 Tax=Fomitiporia mediterranea (strain MF3/22) TaxID=694068 RepID=UPI000440820B|nr:uncharacterized protein FOMMEDRAFT_146925 [Fomitiporia mediterranea MF3/22]EJD03331.1 hypothetical protein FOMMEDRAFT_146925 [Fomitiporia mediterranea MF3/22]